MTTEGPTDWIHWGDASLNRKAGGGAQISTYTVVGAGSVGAYGNDLRPLSWTDGAPTASSSNNTNGLYIAGIGNGFTFTAPADTTLRTLIVHVGGWLSGGRLVAHLSDGSAVDYTDTTPVDSGQFDRNYTLGYRANGPGQTLQVTWTMVAGSGNVTLNGAALNVSAAPGSLQFSAATYSVNESGPSATILVSRTGGSAGAVTVNFATSDGTATTAGSDYTAVATTVSFAAGDSATKTVTIPINNDALVEPDETINLTLSSPTGGALLGSPATAVLTIVDNDAPGSLQFSAAAYSVNESGPTATILVSRTGGSAGAVTVNFATSDGTATTAGSDYTAVTTTVSFAAGDTTNKTVTIPINNDALVEANETINLTLSSPTGGATLGSPATAVLTIVDNDAPGSLQFSAASYSVNESGPTATILVSRTGGSAGAVTVNFATSDGTATTAGSDYTAVTTTVSFAAGDTTNKTVTIPINTCPRGAR